MDRHAYFEHDADVGVIGRGASIEEAFTSAARAVFALMTDLGEVRRQERIDLEFDEADVEFALVTWLNLLLAHSHERGLVLAEFNLARDGNHWRGEAWGEPWRDGLERGIEPKGATLTMLSVARAVGGWEARCLIDV
jgi:SHS2 domain-containing protein